MDSLIHRSINFFLSIEEIRNSTKTNKTYLRNAVHLKVRDDTRRSGWDVGIAQAHWTRLFMRIAVIASREEADEGEVLRRCVSSDEVSQQDHNEDALASYSLVMFVLGV
jgi:hypothetical protein